MRALRTDLQAVSILVKSTQGTVHSVYQKAVNILVDDRIVVVMGSGAEDAPDSIITDFEGSFLDCPIQKNDAVSYKDSELWINDKVMVGFKDAVLFQNGLQYERLNTADDIRKEDLMNIRSFLWTYGKKDALYRAYFREHEADILQEMFQDCFERMEQSDNWIHFYEEAIRMTGLGIGLTPSGDDCIVGISLVFAFLCNDFQEKTEAFLRENRKKTNRISMQMIENARIGRGRKSELILLKLLVRHQGVRIKQYVHNILCFGETSGTDTLIGILKALEYMKHQANAERKKGSEQYE